MVDLLQEVAGCRDWGWSELRVGVLRTGGDILALLEVGGGEELIGGEIRWDVGGLDVESVGVLGGRKSLGD